MKVLIVANHNTGSFTSFVVEQVDALKHIGVEVDFYGIHGKGIRGYLSNYPALKAKIRDYKPDLIHAHYGLSGLLANLQRAIPVVTTYHGSDIHSMGLNLFLSRIAMKLSAYNIFVSRGLQEISGYHGNNLSIIPCGVDISVFYQIERAKARKVLGWDNDGKYVLFAGAFDNEVKNSKLAIGVISYIPNAHLVELRGYSREQVNLVINASNCLLMTSFNEGSPVIIKEAMACGTPVVSVNVGDVKELIAGIDGCYITSFETKAIVNSLNKALTYYGRTQGRNYIIERELSNEQLVKKLISVYQVVNNRNIKQHQSRL